MQDLKTCQLSIPAVRESEREADIKQITGRLCRVQQNCSVLSMWAYNLFYHRTCWNWNCIGNRILQPELKNLWRHSLFLFAVEDLHLVSCSSVMSSLLSWALRLQLSLSPSTHTPIIKGTAAFETLLTNQTQIIHWRIKRNMKAPSGALKAERCKKEIKYLKLKWTGPHNTNSYKSRQKVDIERRS